MNDINDQRSSTGEPQKNVALLLYLAIVAGAVLGVVAPTIIGARGVMSPSPDLPLLPIRVVGLVLLVFGFLAVGILSGGIPPLGTGADESEWWSANSTRAVGTWAMAEGLAILGAVFWVLTGDTILYVGLVAGGFVLLFLNRPQRMMKG